MRRHPVITLVPEGGLANRMKAIDAAVALAREAGSRLRIVWFKDWGLNCRFDELFRPLDLPGVELCEAGMADLVLRDRPRKRNFYLPRLPQLLTYDACLYTAEVTRRMEAGFDFAAWARGRNVYLSACVYFHPQAMEERFRIFRPLPLLQDEIAQRCRAFATPTWGIHIRRTDNIGSITQSPTALFVERMEVEVAKNVHCRFYVATDSEEEKLLLRQRFGERVLTSPRKADRGSLQGMQDALVELYTLSRTCGIMGSAHSSYSETAAQIGRIPCELLTKQNHA